MAYGRFYAGLAVQTDMVVSLIESFHDGMQARVQENGETSEPFQMETGVNQGCVLAPTLFSIQLAAMLMAYGCLTWHNPVSKYSITPPPHPHNRTPCHPVPTPHTPQRKQSVQLGHQHLFVLGSISKDFVFNPHARRLPSANMAELCGPGNQALVNGGGSSSDCWICSNTGTEDLMHGGMVVDRSQWGTAD